VETARATIDSYRDLRVWREAIDIAELCYRLTGVFPREEAYGLSSQIRRAGASIPANIAEGHGRENTRSFIQFLRIAQGSLKELETHLILAERVGLLPSNELAPTLEKCQVLGKMLRSYIRSLQSKSTP